MRTSKTVPWHRVIGAGGRIRVPGEAGLEQRLLLRMEGIAIERDRIDLAIHGHRFPRKR